MQAMREISSQSKLNGRIPNGFESQMLNYRGSRRYVAIWWSEDNQRLIWADGENWRSNAVEEDEWVWWTYTLTMSNDFNLNSLGFDINLSIHVLLLDLEKREVWFLAIGTAFDILVTQSSPESRGQRLFVEINVVESEATAAATVTATSTPTTTTATAESTVTTGPTEAPTSIPQIRMSRQLRQRQPPRRNDRLSLHMKRDRQHVMDETNSLHCQKTGINGWTHAGGAVANAEDILEQITDQDFSYADAVSFAVRKNLEIEEAFAFDRYFVTAGFNLFAFVKE